MIKFIDLKTGNIFNGNRPYIHWFEGEQSTNLIYINKLCLFSDRPTLSFQLKSSDVFNLLNIKDDAPELNIEDIKTSYLNLVGKEYFGNYLYMIYIMGSSEEALEAHEVLEVSDDNNIYEYEIAADFYGENEALSINLSNQGIEIPNEMQKAIYCRDVNDDSQDNILLNRKWKELLANSIDIFVNKGSYQSLINSLEWFEWGNNVKLREIWKREDLDKTYYRDSQLNQIVSDDINIGEYAKTTYLSLYTPLQKISYDGFNKPIYDDEKNPALENIIREWTTTELALKMCMLGNFFETYFMPIHLNLMHADIEDIVYTNTIKVSTASSNIDREDSWVDTDYVKCNIVDNQVFTLTNVSARVNNDTMFGVKYENGDYSDMSKLIVGIDRQVESVSDDNELKTYASQYYNYIGAIIDVECELSLQNDDAIVREILYYKDTDGNNQCVNSYKLFYPTNGKCTISFSLLCQTEGNYEYTVQFISAGGKVFTRAIKFRVIDSAHVTLKVGKILRKSNESPKSYNIYDYLYSLTGNSGSNLYNTYILSNAKVGLNHILIADVTGKDIDIEFATYTRSERVNDNHKYYIYVCEEFDAYHKELEDNLKDSGAKIVRSELIFLPENHYVEEIGKGTKIDDFTLQGEPAIVVPCLESENGHDVKTNSIFLNCVTDSKWEFENSSTGEIIKYNEAIKSPLVADKTKVLTPGYYNIKFEYKIGSTWNEVKLNSAFILK